jgi:hypothetical protein
MTNLTFVDILPKTCKKTKTKKGKGRKLREKIEFEKSKKTEKTEGIKARCHRNLHLQGVVATALQQYTTKF